MGASEGFVQLAPGVYRIDLPLGARLSAMFLFVGSERSVLLDTGCAGDLGAYVVPALAQLGVALDSVETVVVSHCDVDHSGGIADVHRYLPQASVVAHRLDADAMESLEAFELERSRSFRAAYGFDEEPEAVAWTRSAAGFGPVNRRLDGDEEIDLGDRVLHVLQVPGHSAGHLAVHDPSVGLLAISDAILGDAVPLADGTPAFPPTYRFERSYLATIERVRELAPTLLATAHYGVFEGAAVGDFLDTSRDFALGLRRAVRDAVVAAQGGLRLTDLVSGLNTTFGTWPREGTTSALAFPVVGHIEALVEDGELRLKPAADGVLIEGEE